GERAGDLRHLDRVRQPRAVMVAVLGDEDLRLVLQPPEGGRVDDAVAVALEFGARRAGILLVKPAARLPGIRRINGPVAVTEPQSMPVNRHSSPSLKMLRHPPIDAAFRSSYL